MNSASPAKEPGGGVHVFWWVCTKNPFYAISAALVLLGLWISFGNETEELDNWLLMGGLTAYTLLLALTAMLLVRYLKLWDDARTVMLLVVLMFLATSVTFDHLLIVEQERGTVFYLLGLSLSVVVSEMLLRGTKLRLPALYRVPYYLFLMLFFLYPIFVRSLRDPGEVFQGEQLMWGLFGFSTAAGLIFLTLLPALWRGAEYVRGNGSPWPWPLFPWSLFVVLAIAVSGRAVLMCWSLHPLGAVRFDRLIFGPYFLIPLGFALTVLFLELGLSLAQTTMVRIGLLLPLLLIGLALVGHSPADPVYRLLRVMTVSIGDFRAFDEVRQEADPVYSEFLRLYTDRLGADPLFVALVLAASFYFYAAARRVPMALEALAAVLASMALIGTTSLKDGLLSPPEPGPLLAPAAILLLLGIRQRSVWNLLRAAVCLAAVLALAVPLPETAIAGMRGAIFVHLSVLAMLVLGALSRDVAGMSLRRIGAVFLLVFALAGMHPSLLPEGIPWALPIVYPLCLGIFLAGYGHFLRDSWILGMAALVLGYWVFKFGWTAYRAVRGAVKGFDYLVSGLGFFMVGVIVSLGKSGVLTRWIESRWGWPGWLRFARPALASAPDADETPAPPGAKSDE